MKFRTLIPVLCITLALASCSLSKRDTGASNESTVLGAATVSGAIDVAPTVSIDTSVAPATELLTKDIVVGDGETVTADSTVVAHYVGYGAQSGAKFDSSWDGGSPLEFPLSGVIVGWQEGLVGMHVGGRRILVVPGAMGYGSTPPEGSGILPNETLIFVVDLVGTI